MVYRYMLDDKGIEKKEKILREEFDDTIDQEDSICGILVTYLDTGKGIITNDTQRVYIGFPYEITDEIIPLGYKGGASPGDIKRRVLVVGSYQKLSFTTMPEDFESRKKKIPLEAIVSFVKV